MRDRLRLCGLWILCRNFVEIIIEHSDNYSFAAVGKETVADENAMTPKEAKAFSLVKDKWTEKIGNTEGIDFNISIQNDGKYLVTVYDT